MTAVINYKLTDIATATAFTLSNVGLNLNINYIQLGSGNKSPDGTEIALLSPQEYATVGGFYQVGINQNRVSVLIPSSAISYNISEIGLWSGVPGAPGSILVFYYSLPASSAQSFVAVKSTGVDFSLESDIYFGDLLPANIQVIVDANSALSIISSFAVQNFATPLQAQEQVSQNTIISPYTLKKAFQGNNQMMANYGYQIHPGGMIDQWGRATGWTKGEGRIITLPIAMPLGILNFMSNILTTGPSHKIEHTVKSYDRPGDNKCSFGCFVQHAQNETSDHDTTVTVQWRAVGQMPDGVTGISTPGYMYFSATLGGFFPWPLTGWSDWVVITKTAYDAIFAQLATGMVLSNDGSGNPLAINLYTITDLPTVQQLQLNLLARDYASYCSQPISFTNHGGVNKTYHCDSFHKNNLDYIINGCGGSVPGGYYYHAYDNTQVTFNYADLTNLKQTIQTYAYAGSQNYTAKKSLILAASTIGAVQAITF